MGMPVQNASQIKEKIISFLSSKSPSIPVYIAKEVGLSMLFTSAFLSELFSDKRVKMSHLRVGNSPVYYIKGHEALLERFSSNLKSKEKDAYLLLQERKFLRDSEQTPAIRVALREIKDFAFPFKKNGEIYWRYLTASESEFSSGIKSIEQHEFVEAKPKIFDKEERKVTEKIVQDLKIVEQLERKKAEEEIEEEIEEDEEGYVEVPIKQLKEEKEEFKELPIKETKEKPEEKKKVQKEKEEKPKEKAKEKKSTHSATPKKKTAAEIQKEKFFEKIKDFLSKETVEILNIESFGKNEILLRIKSEGEEKLLIAYNKKKISDNDIISANRKASELGLKYVMLSMGETSKKLLNLIEAAQNLDKIEKIEK